jgi:hypothetical protein
LVNGKLGGEEAAVSGNFLYSLSSPGTSMPELFFGLVSERVYGILSSID